MISLIVTRDARSREVSGKDLRVMQRYDRRCHHGLLITYPTGYTFGVCKRLALHCPTVQASLERPARLCKHCCFGRHPIKSPTRQPLLSRAYHTFLDESPKQFVETIYSRVSPPLHGPTTVDRYTVRTVQHAVHVGSECRTSKQHLTPMTKVNKLAKLQ
jgi:hypothetical protein